MIENVDIKIEYLSNYYPISRSNLVNILMSLYSLPSYLVDTDTTLTILSLLLEMQVDTKTIQNALNAIRARYYDVGSLLEWDQFGVDISNTNIFKDQIMLTGELLKKLYNPNDMNQYEYVARKLFGNRYAIYIYHIFGANNNFKERYEELLKINN